MIKFESKFYQLAFRPIAYSTKGSAAVDLRAYLPKMKAMTLYPDDSYLFDLGVKFDMSEHPESVGLIFSRSGLGSRGVGRLGAGVVLTNGVGVIDSDYRGDIKVPLINRSGEPYTIEHGARICQLVVTPIIKCEFEQVKVVDANTARGDGGFGSTGEV